ncbi:MAG: response regulator [bacterium]|nr:response regulator [bacterium]
MATGAEFAGHRPHGDDARPDERHVRILLVEGRSLVADEIRECLSSTSSASFEIVCETDLVDAAAQIQGEQYDLLLMDPQLPGVERTAALDLANELAHRLPVVVLTGTEALERADDGVRTRLATCVREADVAGKLLKAIRRARRLGTGVMTPMFCRIEGLIA